MAQKLKLLFQEQPLALVLKSAVFAALLGFASIANFGLVPVLFFVALAFVLYNFPSSGSPRYLISFIALIFLSLIIIPKIGDSVPLLFLLGVAAFLFYVILGLKNLIFIYRKSWHYLLNLVFIYSISLLFFLTDKTNFFFAKSLGTFLLIFIVLWEFFRLLAETEEFAGRVHPALFAGLSTLLILESFWAISLLPLGILNSANLALLVSFVILDILGKYKQQMLTQRIILIDVTVFTLFAILIFVTSNWTI